MLCWLMIKPTDWRSLYDDGCMGELKPICPMDLAETICWASCVLEKTGLENPRHEARLLVGYGLGIPVEQILYDQSHQLSEAECANVAALIGRRKDHEPFAYITGTKEFWSLEFGVGEESLIPRPASECIVESALDVLRDTKDEAQILDLGTGSGCLLLSVMHERSDLNGVGIDCSYETIRRATDNSHRLNMKERAKFVVGNWGAALECRFDLILCNPPYVRSSEIGGLMRDVSRYEPRLALDGGADGLSCFRSIGPQLSRLLTPGGMVCIEVGVDQANSVISIFGEYGLKLHDRRTDLAGVERCLVFGRLPPLYPGSKKRLGKVCRKS